MSLPTDTLLPLRAPVTPAAVDAVVVTASDTVADPNGPFFALYVGVAAGAIKLTTLAGNDVLLTAVPIGKLDIGCTRVWSTGTTTTAALIVGLK
jgi:hypothetical protein